MSLALFALVWVATWAACWFGLARWWRPHAVALRELQRGQVVALGEDFEMRGGARRWAPVIASACAFAVSALTGGLL